MIYNVHIYREMRLKFDGIEARTPEAAAEIARDKTTDQADEIDDCEGVTLAALVDEAGDDEYERSVSIDFEPERERKTARAALLLLDMVRFGVIGLGDGDAEFQGTVYAFDYANPDWHALADAIGWDTAAAAIVEGKAQ